MTSAVPTISLLVEGDPDEVVARRLLDHVGLACGPVYGKRGKADLLGRLPKYNQAAYWSPWLVMVDLDRDADCAPPFVQGHLSRPAAGMRFRVAVRAVEAWLLADADGLAAFLGVPVSRLPLDPDGELNPKQTLVNLARRSPKRAVREDIVPREGSGIAVGPGYPARLIEFVTRTGRPWQPEVAVARSDSLRRCVAALQGLRGWKPE